MSLVGVITSLMLVSDGIGGDALRLWSDLIRSLLLCGTILCTESVAPLERLCQSGNDEDTLGEDSGCKLLI